MKDSLKGQLAYAYERISDDREGKELGVKRQDEDIDKLAEYLGVTLVRKFVDNDLSASTNTDEHRPNYEEMMGLLETGPIKIVLSYTTSRLTRKPEESEQQIKLARRHGIQFYYVRGQFLDLQVAANRRMARYQAANDAGEAEELQERVLRKKLQDAREGKTGGGRRLYGYGKTIGHNPATGKDICDPYQVREHEIAALQEGKRRTLAGESQFDIIRDWNRRGITRALGGPWSVGPFKRTLLNESYVKFDPIGHPTDCPCLQNPETGATRIHHNERHRARWPYVFTRAEHDALTAMFNGRNKLWYSPGRLKSRTYLLTGIVYCGGTWRDTEREGHVCGGEMFGQGKTYTKRDGSVVRQRRYACKKWDRHGFRVGCCTVFRIADAVEQFVSEQVLYRFDSPEVARALAPADNEERMTAIIQELAELQARREVLAAEYAAGEHDKDDYRVMVALIKEKLALAETEKKQLLSAKAKSLAVPTDGGLREVWETASMEWRASVIRLVVEKVVIHPGRTGAKRWPDKNGWYFDPELIEIVWLH
ncbi:recombinase family protein [Saccharothrix sp. HUAS TT1]|uniref:recombinase family protein n=1 Tax=unclassified Saccharothrix TaxID=2593673 RepID=UPI00345C1B48